MPAAKNVDRDAWEEVGGICCRFKQGVWYELDDQQALQLLRDWRRVLGSEALDQLVQLMRDGHTITSPVCPVFTYRSAGIAGRQQQLGIT